MPEFKKPAQPFEFPPGVPIVALEPRQSKFLVATSRAIYELDPDTGEIRKLKLVFVD